MKDLPCWPSVPHYDQLVQGDALRTRKIDLEDFWSDWKDVGSVVLEEGVDFDIVVLGISIGAFPFVAADLAKRDPKLATMIERVKTTQTQAFQLWLEPDLQKLGWTLGKPVLGAYVEPIDTWADMTHLIPREDWPADMTPGNLAYFCGALSDLEPVPGPSDRDYPKRQRERARTQALAFLKEDVRPLWPDATTQTDPGGIDWSLLVDPEGREGEARFDAQYWRAVTSPSERYVLSVAGSSTHRLRETGTRFSNLVLTGDYILTGISAGCVEAATMAGMQASRAICGTPTDIVGDFILDGEPVPRPLAGETFIERGGGIVLAQPYEQKGTRMYAFLFPADANALASTCDKYLNAPLAGTGIAYRPFGPFATLVAARIEQIHSLDPSDAKKGWLPEKDVGLWMPVVRGRTDGGGFHPEAFAWFIPYIWVDSGAAMATGREVYGFPKELGRPMVFPHAPIDPARFFVEALALEVFAPTTEARLLPMLSVTRDGTLGELEPTFGDIARLGEALREGIETLFDGGFPYLDWQLAETLLGGLAQGRVPMVFLKEFRDATRPHAACYQAVLEAKARMSGFRGAGLLPGDWCIELHSYASHPMARELGLPAGPIRPTLGVWVDLDFEMEVGRTIG